LLFQPRHWPPIPPEPAGEPEAGLSDHEQTILTSLLIAQFARQAKEGRDALSDSAEESSRPDVDVCGEDASILARIRCWFGSRPR
jgi:hypothetical protein